VLPDKAIWVRELRGQQQELPGDRPMVATWGKFSHLLDPSSPPVEPREPYMRIGVPKRTLCGVIMLTIYAVPYPGLANRCGRCQRIAQAHSR
jgi:hypothetical protein